MKCLRTKVAGCLAALLILASPWAAADGYEPVLPKVGSTKRTFAVDAAKDVQGDDAHNVLLAITRLRGLVNRQSAEKVYLVNFPWRLNWDWSKQKRFAGVHPAQATLDDGLLPFPATTAKPDLEPWPMVWVRGTRYKLYDDGRFYGLQDDPAETQRTPTGSGAGEAEAVRQTYQQVLKRYSRGK